MQMMSYDINTDTDLLSMQCLVRNQETKPKLKPYESKKILYKSKTQFKKSN